MQDTGSLEFEIEHDEAVVRQKLCLIKILMVIDKKIMKTWYIIRTTEECYGEETRGCYVAGVFDRFAGEVTELANIPDWTNVEITLDGERYDLKRGKILFYQRQLNIKDGYLLRNVEWQSPAGKITRLSFERFVSLSNIRLAALKVKISPLNYSGYIDIRSGIDGQVSNSGTQHFKEGCGFFRTTLFQ